MRPSTALRSPAPSPLCNPVLSFIFKNGLQGPEISAPVSWHARAAPRLNLNTVIAVGRAGGRGGGRETITQEPGGQGGLMRRGASSEEAVITRRWPPLIWTGLRTDLHTPLAFISAGRAPPTDGQADVSAGGDGDPLFESFAPLCLGRDSSPYRRALQV